LSVVATKDRESALYVAMRMATLAAGVWKKPPAISASCSCLARCPSSPASTTIGYTPSSPTPLSERNGVGGLFAERL